MKRGQSEEKDQGRWPELVSYSSIGVEFAASVLIGVFIGYRLDLYFHTKPYLMVIGLFFGAAAGFYNLYKLARRGELKE